MSVQESMALINANPDIADELERSVMPDKDLIAILKKRGYKVYPEKRVRIYGQQSMIERSTLYQLRQSPDLAQLRRSIDQRNARDIGMKLMEHGALVRSYEDTLHQPGASGEIRRMQVCVVLPNDWDFENEMWGVR